MGSKALVWEQYLDRFFPVKIDTQTDVLLIEDKRPGDGLLLSVVLAAASLFISALMFRPAIASGIYWPLVLFLLPVPIFGIRSLLLPISERYVFNRGLDTYSFSRRSMLKNTTTEGSLSQIRAVQIERSVVTTTGDSDSSTRELFYVTLLLQHGLLLGSSETDHELIWMDASEATRQLSHQSHGWAVELWRKRLTRR
jgi:hypothetical protein